MLGEDGPAPANEARKTNKRRAAHGELHVRRARAPGGMKRGHGTRHRAPVPRGSAHVPRGTWHAPRGASLDPGDAGSSASSLTADQVQQQDLMAMFPDGQSEVWVTRMRADLAHSAPANARVVQASADQTQLSNTYQVEMSINAPSCPPTPTNCPPCGGGVDPGPVGSSSGAPPPFIFGGTGGSTGNSGSGSAAAPGRGYRARAGRDRRGIHPREARASPLVAPRSPLCRLVPPHDAGCRITCSRVE